MPPASSIELPERYRVARHIASGGMASVWEAEDLLLGRVVAVKVLAAHFAADRGARARFQREARTAARVSDHPNIATIYDIGEHADDAFIVMEHFAGGTLADRLREARDAKRRLPRETALRWLREAAAGLDVAHAAGIVHRDVKPANLLLDGQDRLAVGDFGIARLADDTHMTQTGQVLGTAAYLSPEQAMGLPATAASDRYALAVIAYELLTGRRPFEGGPPAALARQHAEARPPAASAAAADLSGSVDAILAGGLAKEPGLRPLSATAFVAELQRALPAGAPLDRTLPLPTAVVAERRPRPAAAPALGLLALVCLVAGVALAIALSGDDPSRQTAQGTTPATQAAPARTQLATTPAVTPSPQTAPAAETPAELNARGFRLIRSGRYAEAIEPLQAAVDGFRAGGQTDQIEFQFALFNLGQALNRSGNPAAAIEVLSERLRHPNQRGKVRAELADARARLGGGDAGKKQKQRRDGDE